MTPVPVPLSVSVKALITPRVPLNVSVIVAMPLPSAGVNVIVADVYGFDPPTSVAPLLRDWVLQLTVTVFVSEPEGRAERLHV